MEEFCKFLKDSGIDFRQIGSLFLFDKFGEAIVFVPLVSSDSQHFPEIPAGYRLHHLYEDRWNACRELMSGRILAHLGQFRRIAARNCTVKRIDAITANNFLERYHIYGKAKCRYKYGLFHKDELVAVSCFSSPRTVTREEGGADVLLRSYEWVRQAGLPDCRINGGMGKMLSAFIREVQPDEVMSYADLEWSDGEVYRKLGFVESGGKEPVRFSIDPISYQRSRNGNGIEIYN
ncbi:MAG: hypothetical protein HUJ90_04515, partial [Bacteroidales bacterium]|nr:hypothetical protein [Bacteroidales bacterium]